MARSTAKIMQAENWLGQIIEVNSVVYYGARSGNSSTYKIGKVIRMTKVTDGDLTWVNTRVEWAWENRYSKRQVNSASTLSVDGCVLVEPNTLNPEIRSALDNIGTSVI